MNGIDILGYVASLLVAVSLSMASIARLRFVNLLGAVAFSIYGWMAGAFPVMAVNAYVVVINVIFLLKMKPGHGAAFELLAIQHSGNRYLQRFLEFHKDEISKLFPHFHADDAKDSSIVLILKDMLPVGVVICEQTEEKSITIKLDFVIPSHRDFRCGECFYESWSEVLSFEGIERFVAHGEVKSRQKYLKKLGFAPEIAMGSHWYSRPASMA